MREVSSYAICNVHLTDKLYFDTSSYSWGYEYLENIGLKYSCRNVLCVHKCENYVDSFDMTRQIIFKYLFNFINYVTCLNSYSFWSKLPKLLQQLILEYQINILWLLIKNEIL